MAVTFTLKFSAKEPTKTVLGNRCQIVALKLSLGFWVWPLRHLARTFFLKVFEDWPSGSHDSFWQRILILEHILF